MDSDFKYINPRLLKSEHIHKCAFPNCNAACCVYGAWVDQLLMKKIISESTLISKHMQGEYSDPSAWFNELSEPDKHSLSGIVVHTSVIDDPKHYGGTACVFMRKDHKCSLQVAAEENNFHKWYFKPFYCILHPLDIDEIGRVTLGNTEELIIEAASYVRQNDKEILLTELFSEELEYFLGKRIKMKNG